MTTTPDYLFVPLAEHELLLAHGCVLETRLSNDHSLTYIAEDFISEDFILAVIYIIQSRDKWEVPLTLEHFLGALEPAWQKGSPEYVPHNGLEAVEHMGKLLSERGQLISMTASVMCLINRNESLLELNQINKAEAEALLERCIALANFNLLSPEQKVNLAQAPTAFDMAEIAAQMANGAPAALIAEMYNT